MDFRNQDPKSLAGLARGARAAIVVPSLIALTLLVIKQPQMAGFAIYGSFAHLVIVNYSQSRATRSAQAATLTLFGALLVCLGTFASVIPWTAVAGAMVIGFLSAWPTVVKGNVAVVRTALMLLFLLAVAVPTPLHFVIPQRLFSQLRLARARALRRVKERSHAMRTKATRLFRNFRSG